jgi:hypothetical protein
MLTIESGRSDSLVLSSAIRQQTANSSHNVNETHRLLSKMLIV